MQVPIVGTDRVGGYLAGQDHGLQPRNAILAARLGRGWLLAHLQRAHPGSPLRRGHAEEGRLIHPATVLGIRSCSPPAVGLVQVS